MTVRILWYSSFFSGCLVVWLFWANAGIILVFCLPDKKSCKFLLKGAVTSETFIRIRAARYCQPSGPWIISNHSPLPLGNTRLSLVSHREKQLRAGRLRTGGAGTLPLQDVPACFPAPPPLCGVFDVTVIKGKTEPDRLSKAAIYRKYLYAYINTSCCWGRLCVLLWIFLLFSRKSWMRSGSSVIRLHLLSLLYEAGGGGGHHGNLRYLLLKLFVCSHTWSVWAALALSSVQPSTCVRCSVSLRDSQ